jgi:hypothetical protein
MNAFKRTLLLSCACIFTVHTVIAQGDGPRTMLLAPKGLWGVDAKWINLQQNISPSGNILFPDGDFTINVFPITAFHTFSLGGRFAQIYAMVNPGKAKGTITGIPIPIPDREADGTSDGFVGFKLGLVNSPALNVAQFMQHTPAFTMALQFRYWYSGSYNQKKAINLGTNRNTIEIGFPMSVPFGKNKKLPWWFETMPSVEIYTANQDPFYVLSPINETKQKPLFVLENHLTKSISSKFWAGVGVRYQGGGKLERDGLEDVDSKLNILGTGIEAGYQVLPVLGLKGTYGWVIYGYNGADSKMIRIGATFTYANMKKVKAEMQKAGTN